MRISDRRVRLGRLQVYIEPRDIWVGVYLDPKAVYLCPLPLVVLRWDRHEHDRIECGCELTAADIPAEFRTRRNAVYFCATCAVSEGEEHLEWCTRQGVMATRPQAAVADPMPVFVIKAKDKLALRAVDAYRRLCKELGLDEQARQVAAAYNEMTEWRDRNPGEIKLPDHPHVPAAGPTHSQPDGVYFCPTSGDVESPRDGGFDVCCDRPDLHRPATAPYPRKEDNRG